MNPELTVFWCTFGVLVVAFIYTAVMFSQAFIGAKTDATGKYSLRRFDRGREIGGIILICIAAAGCVATLTVRGISINKLPFQSIYETLLICAFGTLLAFIALNMIYKVGYLGAVATFFGLVMMMLGFMQRQAESSTLPPALQSWWFIPHVASYIVGYGFCGFAFFVALMDLMGRKRHRLFAAVVFAFCAGFAINKLLLFLARPKYVELSEHLHPETKGYWTEAVLRIDFPPMVFTAPVLIYGVISLLVFLGIFAGLVLLLSQTKFSDTLASLPTLQRVFHWLTMIGFFLLTFGLLSGAAWGKTAWGDYWRWDPKENLGLITWFVYLIYLHLMRQGLRNRAAAAWVNVIGLVVIMFTWFNANMFGGMHAYASTLADTNDFAYVHVIVFAVMLFSIYIATRDVTDVSGLADLPAAGPEGK